MIKPVKSSGAAPHSSDGSIPASNDRPGAKKTADDATLEFDFSGSATPAPKTAAPASPAPAPTPMAEPKVETPATHHDPKLRIHHTAKPTVLNDGIKLPPSNLIKHVNEKIDSTPTPAASTTPSPAATHKPFSASSIKITDLTGELNDESVVDPIPMPPPETNSPISTPVAPIDKSPAPPASATTTSPSSIYSDIASRKAATAGKYSSSGPSIYAASARRTMMGSARTTPSSVPSTPSPATSATKPEPAHVTPVKHTEPVKTESKTPAKLALDPTPLSVPEAKTTLPAKSEEKKTEVPPTKETPIHASHTEPAASPSQPTQTKSPATHSTFDMHTPAKDTGRDHKTAATSPAKKQSAFSLGKLLPTAFNKDKETTTPRNSTMAFNPPTVSDFRKNAERQAKEQQAVGSLLSWVGYTLLGGLVLVTALAALGGFTMFQMIQRQNATVAQLESHYNEVIAKQQADISRLREDSDKLGDQLAAATSLMARQQDQLKRTAATVDDTNAQLKARAREIAELRDRVRRLDGGR
jgi:hypothetical protein